MLTRDPASLWPSPVHDPDDVALKVACSTDGLWGVVRIAGELDLLTGHVANRACLEGDRIAVTVDLAETTFMDCCGYGGLVAARLVLEQRGGTLTVRNQTGQPARLLALLRMVGECPTLADAS
jgi:anti-anti-sigma factor